MDSIHHTYHGNIYCNVVVAEVALHRMQPVDEYFITGEVLAEFVFGSSVSIIWIVREAQSVFLIRFSRKGLQRYCFFLPYIIGIDLQILFLNYHFGVVRVVGSGEGAVFGEGGIGFRDGVIPDLEIVQITNDDKSRFVASLRCA